METLQKISTQMSCPECMGDNRVGLVTGYLEWGATNSVILVSLSWCGFA